MVEVRWSPQAVDDLEAIRSYIGKDSPSYAAIFGEKIVAAAESLNHDPERGRIVPEKNDP
ncbi:MAG: type II toxin-antitoxin system RelE/ParE family toxin, partial [Candidatus Sigynarchaeota archaeon]